MSPRIEQLTMAIVSGESHTVHPAPCSRNVTWLWSEGTPRVFVRGKRYKLQTVRSKGIVEGWGEGVEGRVIRGEGREEEEVEV
uniref:Uncharacterized protein n=1 Tax=Vespula pensylvanica TaxID=30213 RepID=A0A834PAT2_VESPE|nr:hypothetical protein H0235_002801 [Vespula pensylvanica]